MNRGLAMYVLLLCTILSGVRCTNAHVHLCFDGNEPPISVQFEDNLELSGHLAVATSAHHDLDIDIASNLGGKLPKVDLPFIALLFSAVFIAFNLLVAPPLPRARSTRFRYRFAPHFQPPLRGPPV